jgi:hypothetical protein
MRTTLTLDPDNAARLERLRKAKDGRLKEVLNEALRRGFDALEAPPKQGTPFETKSVDLGPFLFSSVKEALRALDEEHDRKKLGLK